MNGRAGAFDFFSAVQQLRGFCYYLTSNNTKTKAFEKWQRDTSTSFREQVRVLGFRAWNK